MKTNEARLAAIIDEAKRLYPQEPDISPEGVQRNKLFDDMRKIEAGLIVDAAYAAAVAANRKRLGVPNKPENLKGLKQKSCSAWQHQFKTKKGDLEMEYFITFNAIERAVVAKAGMRKGEWVWGPYRERYTDRAVWGERIAELEELFFPDLLEANLKATAVEAAKTITLSGDHLTNYMSILGPNGKCSNSEFGTNWGTDAGLILRMYEFCKRLGVNLGKGSKSKRWIDACEAWIKAGAKGDDYYKAIQDVSVDARKNFRRYTGIVFGQYDVDQVPVLEFMNFLKGRGAEKTGFKPPVIDAKENLIEPGHVMVESTPKRDKDGDIIEPGKPVYYTGQFPFTESIVGVLTRQFSCFINFCAQPYNGWCDPMPRNFKHFARHNIARRQNMTIEQFERTLTWYFFYGTNGSHLIPGGATYAASAVMKFFGGLRKEEVERSSGSNINDGYLTLVDDPDEVKTKANPFSTEMMPVFYALQGFLDSWKSPDCPKGHWQKDNLRPRDTTEDCIQYLAGWSTGNQAAMAQAENFLKSCEEHDIEIPARGNQVVNPDGTTTWESWGIPFPANGFRHLALSLHYKLFFDEVETGKWGGTSDNMLEDFYVSGFDLAGHYFTLQDVKRFWLFIPEVSGSTTGQNLMPNLKKLRDKLIADGWGLKQDNGNTYGLPEGHKLDGHLDPSLVAALEEVKKESDQLEINPNTIAILRKRIDDCRSKEENLIDARALWNDENPGKPSSDFPDAEVLHYLRGRIAILRKHLELATKGVCFAQEEEKDHVTQGGLRDQWPGLIEWLKSLKHGLRAQFGRDIKVSHCTVSLWVVHGCVPNEITAKAAYAKAIQMGYVPGTKYRG